MTKSFKRLAPALLLFGSFSLMAADFRLIEAVKSGNSATLQALLQQRIDVNAAEPDGTTALHWAVRGRMHKPSNYSFAQAQK